MEILNKRKQKGGPLLFTRCGPQVNHISTACQPKVPESPSYFCLYLGRNHHYCHGPLKVHIPITLACLPRKALKETILYICFRISGPHLLFYKWATLGSHPFCSSYKKDRSATSLPLVAHICMLSETQCCLTKCSSCKGKFGLKIQQCKPPSAHSTTLRTYNAQNSHHKKIHWQQKQHGAPVAAVPGGRSPCRLLHTLQPCVLVTSA